MKISLKKTLIIEIILGLIFAVLTYPKSLEGCYFGLCFAWFSMVVIFFIVLIGLTIIISQLGNIVKKNNTLKSTVVILIVVFLLLLGYIYLFL